MRVDLRGTVVQPATQGLQARGATIGEALADLSVQCRRLLDLAVAVRGELEGGGRG